MFGKPWSHSFIHLLLFFLVAITIVNKSIEFQKALIVSLGFEPWDAWWKTHMNPLGHWHFPIGVTNAHRHSPHRTAWSITVFQPQQEEKESKQRQFFLPRINVKNDPASIRCWDSNTQPLWYESHAATIGSGPPTHMTKYVLGLVCAFCNSEVGRDRK